MHGIVHVAHACGLVVIVQNFGTKFFLRRGECITWENFNFLKKGKFVISIKIRNFSRSRMTKRTSPLARLEISVSIDISVLEFYGYIGYIGDISVDIFL